jgi:nucleotide-binding universal stress UspA family protein
MERKKKILIPVDFSEYSVQACELGFCYARDIDAKVIVLHAFFTPFFPDTISFNDTFNYPVARDEVSIRLLEKARADLKKFEATIKEKINNKEWPDIRFSCILKEGLPEEEIVSYSNKIKPEMIIMGTRGKDRKDVDLIGSVTAEVIELVKTPLLAIPEKTPFRSLSQVKKVAFGTSFEHRDLAIVDDLFKLLKFYPVEFHFFHLTHHPNVWNEIKLAGIKEYFAKRYPDIPIKYKILDANDIVVHLENFIREESIDIISLSTYKRNLFARIFSTSIARKMLFHTNTPLLVLPPNPLKGGRGRNEFCET